ncbi:cysteine--tRNA ligase [Candidatus Peregrinibacteria bacterium]|nr:cysteine--tRNA ligase [Candidatus Peregrinibacteria bacterium]
MKIFNSKSGMKEEFKPLVEGNVGFYLCGPTVYDNAHLGHGRSAVAFDVIRRYFIYKGYKVKFVSNYTDIDDKMINRAAEEGISVPELAERVIPAYEKDYGDLGVLKPDVQPKATEYIAEMIVLIERLEALGYTYLLDDGVYFDVSRYEDYGKFSGQNLDALQMGARVEVKDAKRNPQDFVLWKLKKEGEPFWVSPWGDGRPGWHIECSAMSWKNLGEKFDIHGGGLDLKFPHHECEVAQSLCTFGSGTFAQYWLHNGFIQVDNEKMSKSLGNFFTLKDIFAKFDPQVVRFMFLQTHYRNPINFSDALLEQSKAGLARLHDFVRSLKTYESVSGSEPLKIEFEKSVCESMDNDFDTSGAFGSIFLAIRSANEAMNDVDVNLDSNFFLDQLERLDKVFGVIFPLIEMEGLDDSMIALIKEREEARASKDFSRSDEIRDELAARGIVLEDTAGGTIWKRI